MTTQQAGPVATNRSSAAARVRLLYRLRWAPRYDRTDRWAARTG
jgi:hypothetical protein